MRKPKSKKRKKLKHTIKVNKITYKTHKSKVNPTNAKTRATKPRRLYPIKSHSVQNSPSSFVAILLSGNAFYLAAHC